MPVFPDVEGCTNAVSMEAGSIEETDSGAVFLVLTQECSTTTQSSFKNSVTVQYLLTDGAFRKDVLFDAIDAAINDAKISLLTSPSDCDGYLYIPFVEQDPKTGFETDPLDRIVPVSDSGVSAAFQSSYLVAPDSIGGLTGQGRFGIK